MVEQILSTSEKQPNATATATMIVVARIIFEAPGSNGNRLDKVDDCETYFLL